MLRHGKSIEKLANQPDTLSMIHVVRLHPRHLPLAFLILTVALLPGCGPEPITSREIERPPTSKVANIDAAIARLDHLLAAVMRQGDKAWFFKMVTSAKGASRHGADFQNFLASLKWSEQATKPSWNLPDGWEEKPGNGLRAATLLLPNGSNPIELTVTSLLFAGEWDDYLVNNVNRWMNQLGQPSLSKETIGKLVKTIPIDHGRKVAWVELVGVMSGQERMGGGSLAYHAPKHWKPGSAGRMRKAAFLIAEGDAQAEVTVIDLPTRAGPGITEVAANVRRWAGQVGLADPQSDALAEMIKPVQVDGSQGKRAFLLGPEEGDRPLGMLAAMVERGDRVWFIKMIGDRKLVENQQPAFDHFLESMKFE